MHHHMNSPALPCDLSHLHTFSAYDYSSSLLHAPTYLIDSPITSCDHEYITRVAVTNDSLELVNQLPVSITFLVCLLHCQIIPLDICTTLIQDHFCKYVYQKGCLHLAKIYGSFFTSRNVPNSYSHSETQ